MRSRLSPRVLPSLPILDPKKTSGREVIRHAPRCAAGLHIRELPNRVANPVELAPDEVGMQSLVNETGGETN